MYVSRTNIVIDDVLVAQVMARYSLRTKREAIDFSLRRAIGGVMTKEEALAMRGTGWDGDLDDLRSVKIEHWG